MARLYAGNAAGAIRPLERGLRLNPFDPQNFHWHRCLALTHHFAGDPAKALLAATKVTQVAPDWRPAWEAMVVCLVTLGHTNEAHVQVQRIKSLDRPPSDVLDQFRLRNLAWAEQIASALKRVG